MFRKIKTMAAIAGAALIVGALSFFSAPQATREAMAQGVIGYFQNGTTISPSVTGLDTTAGIHFGTGFTAIAKHLVADTGAAHPTVSTCGTGAPSAQATDFSGLITATGATACTVTFGTAYASTPNCVATDATTAAGLKLVAGATNFVVSGLTSGDTFFYICIGQLGG